MAVLLHLPDVAESEDTPAAQVDPVQFDPIEDSEQAEAQLDTPVVSATVTDDESNVTAPSDPARDASKRTARARGRQTRKAFCIEDIFQQQHFVAFVAFIVVFLLTMMYYNRNRGIPQKPAISPSHQQSIEGIEPTTAKKGQPKPQSSLETARTGDDDSQQTKSIEEADAKKSEQAEQIAPVAQKMKAGASSSEAGVARFEGTIGTFERQARNQDVLNKRYR